MGCPQCQSDEISPDGVCLICGYRSEAEHSESAPPKSTEEEDRVYSGIIEMDYSEGSPQPPSDIPKWRQELSTRLQQIQQKREAAATRQGSKPSSPPPQPKTVDSLSALQTRLQQMPVRKPQPPFAPPPRQKTLEPIEPQQPSKPADTGQIRNLIDDAVSRQASPAAAPFPAIEHTGYMPERVADEEGRLILLSRTLSGLVDLIVIVLCTGAFVIAADHFSGILVLDQFSLFNFSVLFFLIYFLYSLFFLSASNQTIGMMITDLRVVGAGEKRPATGQIVRRCCVFLVSLFGLGIGLISSLFDRESQCFHDRSSGTYVVRV